MSEAEKIRVMIVDDIVDTRDQLEKLLFFEKDIEVIAKAGTGREAVALAQKVHPDVILMDINMPDMDGIAATEAIMSQDPAVQVIIMSVQGETDYLRRAMLAGAREFLTKPISADDLYKSIRHVHKLAAARPKMSAAPAGGGSATTGGGGGDSGSDGQVIAVFSPKGGVGTSSVAANLAVAIRQQTNKKVVLVDGNVVFGDLSVILNLRSDKTIIELAQRVDELDGDLLNDVLVSHTSQVKVLLAPPDPQRGELVTSDHLRAILEALRHEFDYVVVDTPASFQDRSLAILDLATRIVTLMTLEMHCIRNIKLFLEVADLLEYPHEKVMLVLNKASNRTGIRAEDVEKNIQRKVLLQIGDAAHDVTFSINQGVPLVISKPSHQIARDINTLARDLTATDKGQSAAVAGTPAAPEPAAKAGGLFSRLIKR
ncbi:MAG: CobQ/CobB/MinD/ParA nucleotide binding domain-containing protein [Candidatus Viridilinea halotolerans]|uniref:CobQ/CobB/MinD/ParA nucleotide binding domain-containing protein n=1 Tax=Candidatus Viridilinea halotolerans TaxID=2491704 RepID=A0A426TR10_9CHLR|nr:MAG: CobQ/CobB/MinD/ParA nucleotide binding domain-containing protein [Candidatus Viridilinea halotolerans]